MGKIKIITFSDGFIITHKGKDYKYRGKDDECIKMISEKIHELLIKDRNKLIKEAKNKIIQGY